MPPDSAFQPRHPDFAGRVRDSFSRQPVMAYLGAALVDVRPGYCEIHLPFRPELTQQHGFFHAGMVGTIADNAGGYAAYSLMPADTSVLTVEYKINLINPAGGERLIARAQVIRPGRTLTVCAVDVAALKDGVEIPCAVMQMTVMTMYGMADAPGGK